MKDVWLINGIPGSGKSTISRALGNCFERAVHIEGDKLQECIVSGAVWPGQQPATEELRQIHLNVRNQSLLARSFAEEDFTPVLDYVVVNRDRVDEYKRQLEAYTLRLVTLVPRVAVALERDRSREEKTVAHLWAHLDSLIRVELNGMGLWVDNSDLTVDETVDLILAQSDAAIV